MGLTATAKTAFAGRTEQRGIIEDTVQIFGGALVSLATLTGEVDNHDNAAGYLPMGYATSTATGTTANDAFSSINVNGDYMRLVAVAGASALTDVGSLVYATDENTLTLTRASTFAAPIGFISFFFNSTTFHVKLFSLGESAALAAAGGSKQVKYLGRVDLTTLPTGNVKAGLTLFGRGKITGFYTITEVVTADADADATLNLEIDGVNLTGGVITLGDTGDPQPGSGDTAVLGARINASSITAANTFGDGSSLDIESVLTNAYATGEVGVYIEYESLLGA